MGDKFKTILKRTKNFLLFIGLFIKEYFIMCAFTVSSNIKLNKPNTFSIAAVKLHKMGKRKAAMLASSLNYLPGVIAVMRAKDNGSIELFISFLENKDGKDNYVKEISDKFQTSINNIFN